MACRRAVVRSRHRPTHLLRRAHGKARGCRAPGADACSRGADGGSPGHGGGGASAPPTVRRWNGVDVSGAHVDLSHLWSANHIRDALPGVLTRLRQGRAQPRLRHAGVASHQPSPDRGARRATRSTLPALRTADHAAQPTDRQPRSDVGARRTAGADRRRARGHVSVVQLAAALARASDSTSLRPSSSMRVGRIQFLDIGGDQAGRLSRPVQITSASESA